MIRNQLKTALWKDADPDIPVLKQAKLEFERLKVRAVFSKVNHPYANEIDITYTYTPV